MEYEQRARTTATPARAWTALADVTAYPRWTASMTRVTPLDGGMLAVGRRYRVHQPGMPANTWTVTEVREGEAYTWTAHAVGVTTTAYHRLAPLPGGGTEILAGLRMVGALSGLLARLLGGKVRRSVDLEVAGLKQAAEADPV
jgi:hypothetical protein